MPSHCGRVVRVGPWVVAALLGAGCRHAATAPGSGSAAAALKVAVLPAESDAFPSVATELNSLLRAVRVKGGGEPVVSKVTLEVAQLSIECVEATPTCIAGVGKALAAQRLVYALIGSTREVDKALAVSVTLFDVDAARPIKTVEHSYRNVADALRRLKRLVRRVTDGTTEPAGAIGEAGG